MYRATTDVTLTPAQVRELANVSARRGDAVTVNQLAEEDDGILPLHDTDIYAKWERERTGRVIGASGDITHLPLPDNRRIER